MLVVARNTKVGRFVYASSISTYGHPALPKVEAVGKPLTRQAVTKWVDELYSFVG